MNWTAILFVIAAALFAWIGLRMIRGNPQLFSKENLGESFHTLAILALLLIVFISLLVLLLRSGA